MFSLAHDEDINLMHSARSGQPGILRMHDSRAASSSQSTLTDSATTAPSTVLESASELAQEEIELVNEWTRRHWKPTKTPSGLRRVSSLLIGDTDWDAQAELRSEQVLQTLFKVAMRFSDSTVGSREDDYHVLIESLRSHENDHSYLAILDGLHGVNNHSSSQWKDYFLEHHDELLAALQDSPSDVSYESGDEVQDDRAPSVDSSKHASRSRSLAPPKPIACASGRNRFTEDDRHYLIQMAQKMKRQDPNVSLKAICEKVAEKALNHPPKSWRKYLSANKDIRNMILDAEHHAADEPEDDGNRRTVYDGLADSDHESEASENKWSPRLSDLEGRQVRTREIEGTHANENENDIASGESELWLSERRGDAEEDIRNLGQLGDPYNEADDRTLARYMASDAGWCDRPLSTNIKLFYEKYKTRSHAAWVEHYRNNGRQLEELAHQFKLHYAREQKRRMDAEDSKYPKLSRQTSLPLRKRTLGRPHTPPAVGADTSSSNANTTSRTHRQQTYDSGYWTQTYGPTRNTGRYPTGANGSITKLGSRSRGESKQKYREGNASADDQYGGAGPKSKPLTIGRTKSSQKRRREANGTEDEGLFLQENVMKRPKITDQHSELTGRTFGSVVNQFGSWLSNFWEG